MANHLKFIARTVMVQNGNVDAAYKMLNRELDHLIQFSGKVLTGFPMNWEQLQSATYVSRQKRAPMVSVRYDTILMILTTDGIVEEVKQRRYYEKPCNKRRRIKYETCQRIYNSEMARKIAFLSRKSRTDPWPGQ